MTPDATRTRILTAARELMLERSYTATSVDDICTAAGVSKGSFYHFFDAKEELGLAVLERFYREGVARIRDGAYRQIEDPHRRLVGFFDHLETMAPAFWRHGCLLGNFATELAGSNPRIQERVGEIFDELVAGLVPVFLPVVGSEEEAAELAEEMLMMLEGAIVLARAHDDPERITAGVRRFRRRARSAAGAMG